ncbi:MAG TPA: iron-containing alcohol dehydrogenase [Dehalococcoidia bacterium]|nr:iron-containing alcohol dehydrogenase [Dehalococcoidia bacterium]
MPSFALRVETVFGDGSIAELGQRAKAAGYKHALVVTDPGIRSAGILDSVLSSLDEQGIAHSVYENVTPNPTIPEVDGGVQAFQDSGADFVVAVGGGSAMDAAKGVAVTAQMGGTSKTYLFGAGTVPFPSAMKPLFAIPTTCGTGSEISPAAVITDPDTHYKHLMLNCTPNVAILDPNLVAKMPPSITAATGMDALTHAMEAYVNQGNTPFTRMFATRAIHQISANLRQAVNGPDRPTALRNMLYAANIAGQSMSNGLGQVHGLSHVVSGRLGTPHGVANAILLSQVFEYHKDFLKEQMHEMAPLMGINAHGVPADKVANEVVATVRSLRDEIKIPSKLSDVGMKESDVAQFVDDAQKSQGVFIAAPRTPTADDLAAIYKSAL